MSTSPDDHRATRHAMLPPGAGRHLRLLRGAQRERLRPELLDVIEYRKSGLSVTGSLGDRVGRTPTDSPLSALLRQVNRESRGLLRSGGYT